MNKFLKNFLCSTLFSQGMKETKKMFPNNNWGDLLVISFISKDGKNIEQKQTYENYSGGHLMNDEEIKKFKKMFKGIDIEKEFAGTGQFKKKSILIIAGIFLKEKMIKIKYTFEDKTTQEIIM